MLKQIPCPPPPSTPTAREVHVLWEGKAGHYSNDANVYRIVAVKQEHEDDEVVPSWDNVSLVTERRSADALGSPIWVNDGHWDNTSAAALIYFVLQIPGAHPEWLRTWYNRQRDLPLRPLGR
jgi:hypothetical protein